MDLFDCMPHFADDHDDDDTTEAMDESYTERINFARNDILVRRDYFSRLTLEVIAICTCGRIHSPFQLT